MKAEDLMIGDWVKFNNSDLAHQIKAIAGKSVKVDKVYWYSASKLSPIPITSEILEKNGWEETPTGYVFYTDGKRYDNSLWYIFGSNTFVVNAAEFQIKYVHQLQHALKLCGIEKEIVL